MAKRPSAKTLTNPFPGLRSYSPHESGNFYGRDEQVTELARKIKRNRLITVLGASGSGKSSLIRAGLLPKLNASLVGDHSLRSHWETTEMTPGGAPLARLAQALFAVHQNLEHRKHPEADPDVLAKASSEYTLMAEALLSRSSFGLVELVKQLNSEHPVLILVDQFEELFRITSNNSKRNYALAFIKLLLEAVKQTEVPVYIVITMRSDFLGDCTKYEGLPEAINRSQYLIPRMNRQQRRDIILGPLQKQGVDISARLVNRLLNDLGDEPDQLPIFQHALMRMWFCWHQQGESNQPIDLSHYQAIGTLSNALNVHAESIFDPLNEPQKQLAEKIFKCLSELTQDSRVVRRPAAVSELMAICETDFDRLAAILTIFRNPHCSFLTPNAAETITEDSIIDVSHESLFRLWQQVMIWIKEESQSAEQYWRLSELACRYNKQEASLMRNPELDIAVNWQQKTKPNPAWAARYDDNFQQVKNYIAQSVKQHIADKQQQEVQHQKEIATAKKIRYLKNGLLMFCIIGIAILGLFSQHTYKLQQKSESLKLAIDAKNALLTSPEQAAYTAILALQKSDTYEAKQALNQAYSIMHRRSVYFIDWQSLNTLPTACSNCRTPKPAEPDAHAATACNASPATASSGYNTNFTLPKILATRKINEQTLISVTSLGTILVGDSAYDYDLGIKQTYSLFAKGETPSLLSATDIHHDPATNIVTIAIASLDTQLRLIQYDPGQCVFSQRKIARDSPVTALTISPDGSTLATGDSKGQVQLVTVIETEKPPVVLTQKHTEAISALRYNANGKLLASGGWDGAIYLYDTDSHLARNEFAYHDANVSALHFHEGPTPGLVSGDRDGNVRLWYLYNNSLEFIDETRCSNAEIVDLEIVAANRLVCATHDGIVKLYKLSEDGLQPRYALGNSTGVYINDISVTQSATNDNTLREAVLVSRNNYIVAWDVSDLIFTDQEEAALVWYSRLSITQANDNPTPEHTQWLASVANNHRLEVFRHNGAHGFETRPTYVINTDVDFVIQAVAFDNMRTPKTVILKSNDGRKMEHRLNDAHIYGDTVKRLTQLRNSKTCKPLFNLGAHEHCLPEL